MSYERKSNGDNQSSEYYFGFNKTLEAFDKDYDYGSSTSSTISNSPKKKISKKNILIISFSSVATVLVVVAIVVANLFFPFKGLVKGYDIQLVNGEYVLLNYSGDEEDLVIPDNVVNISDYAFSNCSTIRSVTIPNSVTSINLHAFSGCDNLTSVTIGDSVTSIGQGAFDYCENLEAVNISSLESWCKIDFEGSGANPLSSAENLYLNGELVTDLVIPKSITEIKESTFTHCKSLTSVTIDSTLTCIEEYAFNECSNLTSVNINDLEAWCGMDFGNLQSNPLYYAENLYLNGELVTDLTIPSNVTNIKEGAFYNCQSLNSLTIPSSVKDIGFNAFSKCPIKYANIPASAIDFIPTLVLEEVVINSGANLGENGAFSSCDTLTTVTLPEGMTSINNGAFV